MLETRLFCPLHWLFVKIVKICVIVFYRNHFGLHITTLSLRYSREFIITVIVITEFECELPFRKFEMEAKMRR